jgi:undecaprenyl-diphosphatase
VRTFEAVVFGIVHGFAEILPIGASAHDLLLSLFGWTNPGGVFSGALALGALLSVLVYFRHDWASVAASFLQVLIYRKRPMTLDERLPGFLLAATIPVAGGWYYFGAGLTETFRDPAWMAGSVAASGILLWLGESMNRKNKGMFDLNWLDSLVYGVFQALQLLPGGGRSTGAIAAGSLRNYHRDAIAKFGCYCSAPLLAGSAFVHLREIDFDASVPMADLSWFTFGVTVTVTFFAGLLSIGGLMKQVQRKGFRGYAYYRFALAAAILTAAWYRNS